MAVRPIFVPRAERGPLVETIPIDIRWHGGFSVSQKQKNIVALHSVAKSLGLDPVLEISTKSFDELGRRLSAFNLKIQVGDRLFPLESVYQSSKVFAASGRHESLLFENPFVAKKKIRTLGRGEIVSFKFLDREYPTEPKNAFYDWLYIRAIAPHEEWMRRNLNFRGYSDIEFTPSKSINCQGRAVAEFHALMMRNVALECAYNFDTFRALLSYSQRSSGSE